MSRPIQDAYIVAASRTPIGKAPKGAFRNIRPDDLLVVALRAALKDPTVVQRMTELGAEFVPDSKLTPEGLRSWLKQETERWGPVIKSAGVYAD